MQLGTRWQVGTPPPSRLPEPVRAEIHAVEAQLDDERSPGHPLYWTLTWLENRPICRCDAGITVLLDAHDAVIRTLDSDTVGTDPTFTAEEDEDWLT